MGDRFQHNGMSWQQSIRVALCVMFLGVALLGTANAADTSPPSTPSGLTATAASPVRINLSWNASTDDVGVTGYRIERCTGSNCNSFAQIATSTTTNYSDTGLTPRTTYRYRIRAYDVASNLSGYSSIVSRATPADNTAPSVPAGLTVTAASSTQLNLSWTASTDNVGVTGYRIERCTGASCSNFSQIATSTVTSYSNTGLTPNTTYRYRIRANDAAGNSSGYSSIVSRATPAADTTAPSIPAGLTATAASSTQLNLSWTASTDNVGVMGYRIERCTGSSCTTFVQIATSTTTSYSNTGLTESTTYRYRIRANDAAGNLSGYSSIANGTTPSAADTTPPTAPANLTATAVAGSQINLTWTASTDNVGVAGYSVERCVGMGCTSFAQVATPTTASYSDTGLIDATTYLYRVRATDAANNLSSYSTTATAATPDTTPPSAPANLTAAAISSTQVNLSWMIATDNVGVTSYLIERCEGIACSSFAQVGTSATATYTDISLTAASSYAYRIRATDAENNLSGYSNVANTATQYGGPITFTYSYDKLGRVTQATGSDGSAVIYSYDANGNITSINRQ